MTKTTDIVRWLLTAALLVLIWLDVKWALYLTVTLMAIAIELNSLIHKG